MRRGSLLGPLLFLWLFLTAPTLFAKDVVIVTSFPKELFETYKKSFEAKNSSISVVINSKRPMKASLICAKQRRSPMQISFGLARRMLFRR